MLPDPAFIAQWFSWRCLCLIFVDDLAGWGGVWGREAGDLAAAPTAPFLRPRLAGPGSLDRL